MIRSFKPRMEVLPPAQQRLWAALRPAQELGLVLYGGRKAQGQVLQYNITGWAPESGIFHPFLVNYLVMPAAVLTLFSY